MGKKVLKRFAMGCAAGAMLVAAGCGGGGGSSAVTAASVNGVVADGYLRNAIVFVDVNGNKVWDEGTEPMAVTGDRGAYTLSLQGFPAADPTVHPIVVRVPDDAIDEDTMTPVGKEYLMSAPPGQPEFVSPLTTLVHNRLEENPALGVDAAVAAVKSQLGMTDTNVDIFKDYVAQKTDAESSDDRNNYAKAHEIAKVVAGVVKDNMEAVKTAVGGTVPPEQLDAALKVALKQVADNLPVIVEKVSEAIETGLPVDGSGVDVQGIMQELAGQVVIDPGAVTSAMTEQEQKAPAVASSFQDALAGDGLHWFEMDQFDGQTFYEYGIVKLGTATQSMFPLTEQLFFLEGGTWVEGQSSESEYVLTANGWIAEDDSAAAGKVMFLSDGSAVWVRTLSGMQEKITISAMNMAGKTIMIPSGNGMSASRAVYPAGSILYRLTFTPLQDVFSYMGDSAQFPSFTNLNDFMAAYTAEGNYRIVMGENFGFQFGAQTAQDAGEVKFYTNPFSPGAQLLPLTGSWKKKLVHGQTILTVTIPAGYKRQYMDMDMNEELIFFVQDGGIQQGHVEYANIPDMQDDLNFNKTAFDAFEAAWRSTLVR